jgi:hypothetical protein
LRATAGVVVAMVLFGGLQLMRFAAPKPALAGLDPEAIERAQAVLATSEEAPSNAALALLGEKRFLFSDSGRSFIMYGIQGRSWIAMGRPVGPEAERLELLWRFRERCDTWGGRSVFYEVGPESLPDLVELGLTFFTLGEQAFVPLAGFGLDGPARSGLRESVRRAERDGAEFAVLPPADVPALLPQLRSVPDAWLESKGAREKGFSLGRFDPGYLVRFPLAVVRKEGELVAFADLWTTAGRREVSIDLMRFRAACCATSWTTCSSSSCSGAGRKATPGSTSAWRRCRARRTGSWRHCGPVPARCCSPTGRSFTILKSCGATRTSSSRSGSRATWRRPAGWRWPRCWLTSPCWSAAAPWVRSAGDAAWPADATAVGTPRPAH